MVLSLDGVPCLLHDLIVLGIYRALASVVLCHATPQVNFSPIHLLEDLDICLGVS